MADRDRTDRDQTLRADKADGSVVAPAGAEANKGWSLGGALGWLALALGTLGFIWFVSHQLGAGWEGRENQAVDLDGKTVVPAGPLAASVLKQAGATTVPSAPVAPAN